jgi:hypothetical protein
MGVLERVEDIDDLYKRIDIVYLFGSQDIRIHPLNIFLVLSEKDISFINEVNLVDNKFNAHLEKQNGNFYTMKYSRRWGNEIFKGYAHVILSEYGWIIISDEKKTSPLAGLLDRLRHHIVYPSLRSQNLVGLIERVKEQNPNYEMDIYFMTARKPGKQTENTYKDVEIKQMQDKLRKSFFIDRIKMRITLNGYILYDCVLSRKGFFHFNRGNFRLFKESIIEPVLSLGQRKIDFYSNRGISLSQEEIKVRPIEFAFEKKLDIKLLNKLGKGLEKITHFSVAAVNKGNPSYLAHVIDNIDGSVFDVSATGKKIFITPTLDTSAASILRISEHISRIIREGNIRDYRDKNEEPGFELRTIRG